MTLNSPDAFKELYTRAARSWDAVKAAELMREAALKSIGFNGVRP